MLDLAMITACLILGADPVLVRAIIEQESAGDVAAVHINQWDGAPPIFTDIKTSVAAATLFIDEGYTVDVGLMGINSKNLQRLDQSVKDAFEPCTNIQLGEHILMQNIETAKNAGWQGDQALQGALSLYNTGSLSAGFANGYVEKVWARYRGDERIQAQRADTRVEWTHGATWSEEVSAGTQRWTDSDE